MSASSPLPPEKEPVRKSLMNGQIAKLIGQPGLMKLTIAKHASPSAVTWASVPANVAGAVAPA